MAAGRLAALTGDWTLSLTREPECASDLEAALVEFLFARTEAGFSGKKGKGRRTRMVDWTLSQQMVEAQEAICCHTGFLGRFPHSLFLGSLRLSWALRVTSVWRWGACCVCWREPGPSPVVHEMLLYDGNNWQDYWRSLMMTAAKAGWWGIKKKKNGDSVNSVVQNRLFIQ